MTFLRASMSVTILLIPIGFSGPLFAQTRTSGGYSPPRNSGSGNQSGSGTTTGGTTAGSNYYGTSGGSTAGSGTAGTSSGSSGDRCEPTFLERFINPLCEWVEKIDLKTVTESCPIPQCRVNGNSTVHFANFKNKPKGVQDEKYFKVTLDSNGKANLVDLTGASADMTFSIAVSGTVTFKYQIESAPEPLPQVNCDGVIEAKQGDVMKFKMKVEFDLNSSVKMNANAQIGSGFVTISGGIGNEHKTQFSEGHELVSRRTRTPVFVVDLFGRRKPEAVSAEIEAMVKEALGDIEPIIREALKNETSGITISIQNDAGKTIDTMTMGGSSWLAGIGGAIRRSLAESWKNGSCAMAPFP